MSRALLIFLLGYGCAFPAVASADEAMLRQQVEQLTAAVHELTATVQSQAERLARLEGSGARAPLLPATAIGSGRVPVQGGSLSAFNPEIGVLADVVAQSSESSAEGDGNDTITARELELVFGHAIDPYSRLDVTASFSELEGASLEEAYITHWGLPGEMNARIGRFKPKAGKAVAIHRDSLDTVDEPLVVAQYFGAEGLSRTGVDVSGFLPLPWEAVTHELTAGVLQGGVGEGGTLFGATLRRPTYYAHLKNFAELSDLTNVEMGATVLSGSKDADDSQEVQAYGVDATLIHHVTPANKLKWQNELYVQDRDEAFEEDPETGEITVFRDNPWGLYSLLDYRLSPRVGVGGRFDYVEPVDTDPASLTRAGDTAWSAYVTLYQSEFARWRLQARHTDFAQGGDDNTVFVQGTMAIGVHKHQLQ